VIKKHWVIVVTLAVGSMSGIRADEVPPAYQMIARENGLPAPLFYAVALTESGQRSLSQHRLRPWPWTLNVNGRGQFFASRKAAWRALQRALASDERSVDIGLMQINWRYHHQALGSAWQALDPYHNLRVGAAILRRCYTAEPDWWESLGCYHAPNDSVRAKKYRERVTRHWRRITQQREG
jgi:soluble lytic murein transglycosylase-like protein